jgi:hypothetical protein
MKRNHTSTDRPRRRHRAAIRRGWAAAAEDVPCGVGISVRSPHFVPCHKWCWIEIPVTRQRYTGKLQTGGVAKELIVDTWKHDASTGDRRPLPHWEICPEPKPKG